MDIPLKDLFSQAHAAKDSLDKCAFRHNTEDYEKLRKSVFDLFLQCNEKVGKLGLFSENETTEDLITNEIQYLSIPYYLAVVCERTSIDPHERLMALQLALRYYTSFLSRLDSYQLLPKFYKSKYLSIVDASDQKELLNRLDSMLGKDAVERRSSKIETFKLERELEQKLASADASSADEEVIRSNQFFKLTIQVIHTFNFLQALASEIRLLDSMQQNTQGRSPPSSDSRNATNDHSLRIEPEFRGNPQFRPLLTPQGKVNRPFTIVSSRDQIKKNVFGTGQYLPTMTVEEYLQEEMKRGGIIEGGGEESAKQESEDEDDMEAADRDTYKKRAWDEFVEANPKGSGNTINRG